VGIGTTGEWRVLIGHVSVDPANTSPRPAAQNAATPAEEPDTMSAETDLLNRFYGAFQRLDGAAMAACYHPQARFTDPVFPLLTGSEIGAMWTMLTQRAKNFTLTFRDVAGSNGQGSAHWEAHYLFSATGRQVHNIIDSSFRFRDGLIVEQHDVFDFWRWSRQALGAKGALLGWAPFVQKAVQRQAGAGLAAWQRKPG